MEGKIHKDVFSLFYSVWSNPDTKINQIVKHLLGNSAENSRTWSIHLKFLSQKYGLMDPLECLKTDPPPKSQYKEIIQTKICAYFEKSLRTMAAANSRMKYLHVSLTGLRGRRHPALDNIVTTVQVQKSRIQWKMLAGDYLTYEIKSKQSGGSPHCRCCPHTPSSPLPPEETILHIVTECLAYSSIRTRIVEQYRSTCLETRSSFSFEKIYSDSDKFCQVST